MKFESLKIYLTKSASVAKLIAMGLETEREKNDYIAVGYKAVNEDCRLPSKYHNSGWFMAYAEWLEDAETYQLIFA